MALPSETEDETITRRERGDFPQVLMESYVWHRWSNRVVLSAVCRRHRRSNGDTSTVILINLVIDLSHRFRLGLIPVRFAVREREVVNPVGSTTRRGLGPPALALSKRLIQRRESCCEASIRPSPRYSLPSISILRCVYRNRWLRLSKIPGKGYRSHPLYCIWTRDLDIETNLSDYARSLLRGTDYE